MHYRLRLLAFPIRASRRLCRWPDVRSLRFRRVPFRRDVVFDPGGATAPRITVPHMLPSTLMTGSASATLWISRLNPTPQRIAVYASQLPSPTTTQHSLPGGPLRPYPCRSSTGWSTLASPDAPQVPDSAGFLPDPCNKVPWMVLPPPTPSVPEFYHTANYWPAESIARWGDTRW